MVLETCCRRRHGTAHFPAEAVGWVWSTESDASREAEPDAGMSGARSSTTAAADPILEGGGEVARRSS